MKYPLLTAPDARRAPERSAVPLPEALRAGAQAMYEDGDLQAGRSWFELAARTALRDDDVEGLAEAALGLGGLWVHEHRSAVDSTRVAAWQRHALRRLEASSPLAARLAVRLAAETDYPEGTHAAVLAAVDSARTGGDALLLAEALSVAHHCLLGPQHSDLRLQLAQELLGVAALTGRRLDATLGLVWRTVDLLLVGDPHAGRSLRELTAAQQRHPLRAVEFVLSAIQVMQAIRRGDLAGAEERAATCAESGRSAGDIDALGWYAAQLVAIRWFQGRIGELVPMLDDLVHSPTLAVQDDSLLAALAVAAVANGDRTEAVSALRRLDHAGLDALRQSSTWLVTLAGTAEAAAALGDARLAADVYTRLLPYAAWPIMASLAVVCFGSVQQPLGVAALATGDLDRAEEHFEAAVAANEALAHRPALQQSRLRLAEVRALRQAAVPRPPAVCRKDGSRWRVELSGRTASVPDSTGMRYLSTLLGNPGREIPAAQLAGLPDAGSRAEPLLDDAARSAYRRRVVELQADIDAAQDAGDGERKARAKAELDWVLSEVEQVTGLAGRSRRFTDDVERARTSVQKALRRAIDRIGEVDEQLARELRSEVVTGARCCFRPRV